MLRVPQAASHCAILGLAALFVCPAFAQEVFEPVANDDSQRRIVEQIRAIHSRDGVYAEDLIAPFTELALLYEQGADHALAIAALERAIQLVRVNRGIHSFDQAPLIQQAIRNEEARGSLTAALDREQELLALAKRHPEDLRTVPFFVEIAEKRMALFERASAGEYPDQMIRAGYCLAPQHCARSALVDVQIHYADAIKVLLRNKLYASVELRAFEVQLAHTAYLGREYEVFPAPDSLSSLHRVGRYPRPARATVSDDEPGFIVDGVATVDEKTAERLSISDRLDGLSPSVAGSQSTTDQGEPGALPSSVPLLTSYDVGRRSLGRLYDYETASPASAIRQVDAATQIADWDLLYSRNALALESYAQVYAWLMEAGAQAVIEALFSPQTPVVLPAFTVNPLLSEATEDSTGFIDVAFSITKYGEARRVEVLDTSMNATGAARERLVALISGSQFRPRVVDNELGRASRVEVRYYLPAPSEDSGNANQ